MVKVFSYRTTVGAKVSDSRIVFIHISFAWFSLCIDACTTVVVAFSRCIKADIQVHFILIRENFQERKMIGEFVTVLAIVFLLVVLAIECWKVWLNETKLKAFHHVRGYPVIGKAIALVGKNNEQIFKEFSSHTDDLCYTWLGPVLIFHAGSPKDFQSILTSENFLKKAFPYEFLYNRTGILTSEPHIWKQHRRALNPTLGPKMVSSFIPIFNEKFQKMCDLMERKLGGTVDMHNTMFKAAIDTILSASYGINWTMQNKRGDDIHEVIIQIMLGLQKRIQRIWLWNPIYKFTGEFKQEFSKFLKFYQFNRSALETKKMELAEKLVNGEDELELAKESNSLNYLQKCLILQRQGVFSDENVEEEMDTIFVGSVDTSAITTTGILLMLAIHSEYQDRVVDELREIFADADEPVTQEHISKMNFLELVIKEAMRFFPIAPIIGRECTADFPIGGGIIPKGSQVFLNMIGMNKNPAFWGENAGQFYPERFLNTDHWHPYQYIPFSAGPRNCIGKRYAWTSLKIAMAYLLRKFKFLTDLTEISQIDIKPELLLKIGNKDALRIERRNF